MPQIGTARWPFLGFYCSLIIQEGDFLFFFLDQIHRSYLKITKKCHPILNINSEILPWKIVFFYIYVGRTGIKRYNNNYNNSIATSRFCSVIDLECIHSQIICSLTFSRLLLKLTALYKYRVSVKKLSPKNRTLIYAVSERENNQNSWMSKSRQLSNSLKNVFFFQSFFD